jgi:nucleoid DNA-binding protein
VPASKVLTKSEIAQEVEEITGIKPNLVKNVIDAIAEIADDQLDAGYGFTLPGVATIKWAYTAARKKGEMYKKGETYTGFGGVEQVAEADSKARKQSIKLRAAPAPALKRLGKDATVQKRAIAQAKK